MRTHVNCEGWTGGTTEEEAAAGPPRSINLQKTAATVRGLHTINLNMYLKVLL
jgi:hypothetical protein